TPREGAFSRSTPTSPSWGRGLRPIAVGLGAMAIVTGVALFVSRTEETRPVDAATIAATAPPDAAPPATTAVTASAPPPELRASRTDQGFLLNFILPRPPDELLVKLGGESGFRSSGENPSLVDPSTGAMAAKTWIVLPSDTGKTEIFVKYRKNKQWAGPF